MRPNGSATRLVQGGVRAAAPNPAPLAIARWATDLGITDQQLLGIALTERELPVAQSTASGEALVSNGHLGADLIRLGAGEGFAPHTHPGDHLLIVVAGEGTVAYGGVIYPTRAGDIYLIDGSVPHAVGAITDHIILAVGAPHLPIDSGGRMAAVAYETVLSECAELDCLICNRQAVAPLLLHDHGCPHCPCAACRPAALPRDGG